MSLADPPRRKGPPSWVIVVSVVLGAAIAVLATVFDSVFLFKGSLNVWVFVIAWPVAALFVLASLMSIREQFDITKRRLEMLRNRRR